MYACNCFSPPCPLETPIKGNGPGNIWKAYGKQYENDAGWKILGSNKIKPDASDPYKHLFCLMVRWGAPHFNKFCFFPLFYESQVCGNSQKYQVFQEHDFIIDMVLKDHFFYCFQITEAMLQGQAALPSSHLKSGPGTLSKVIKELRRSQNQPFPLEVSHLPSLSLTPFQSYDLA